MKLIYTVIAVLLISVQQLTAQTNYYSQSATNLHLVANWNTMPNGSGTAPANFTNSNQVFIIDESPVAAISAAWTVSGTGSKVIVGDGLNALTFSTGTSLITGTFDVKNLAVLNVQSSSAFTVGVCATGSTVNYSLNGTQVVPGGTYYHLSISNATAARVKTAQGDIVVNGDFSVTANNTLTMNTFQLGGSPGVISGTGTISSTHTATVNPVPSGKSWTQTVVFGAAASQTIPAGIYQNLTISGGANNVKTASGDLNVPGTLSVAASTVIDMSTFQLVGVGTPTITGTLRTANASPTPVPAFKTYGGTVLYNSASPQTVVSANYAILTTSGGDRVYSNADSIKISGAWTTGSGNLTFTGTSISLNGTTQTLTLTGQTSLVLNNIIVSTNGVKSFSATTPVDVTINGELNIPNTSRTLAMGTNRLLLGMSSTLVGNGIFTTAHVLTTTPVPNGVSWPYNVQYTATVGQSISPGTYDMLTISGGGTATATGDVTVTNNLNISGAFSLATFQLFGVGGTISGTSTISTNHTATALPLPAGKSWTATVVYSAAANQTIVDGTYLAGIQVTGGNNAVKTPVTDLNVGTILTVAASTVLDMGTFALTAVTISNSGTIRTANTSAAPLPAGKTIGGTIEYTSAASQNVVYGIFTSLNLTNGDRVLSAADSIKISGTWTTGAGNITATGSMISLNGGTQTLNIAGQTSLVLGALVVIGTGTKTFSSTGADITINDELSIPAAARIISFATNRLLLGGGAALTGTGGVITTCTLANPVPAGYTWPYLVTYNAATQNVMDGTYQGLTIATAGVKTAQGDITVNGVLTVTGTLNMVTFMLDGAFTPAGTGTMQTQNTTATPVPGGRTWAAATFQYNAVGVSQTVASGQYVALTLTGGDRVLDNTGDIKVSGTLTCGTGVITATGSTVEINGATTQTLTLPAGGVSFNNLNFSTGTVKTISTGPVSVTGTLTIASAVTVAMGTNALASVNTLAGSGAITTGNTGTTPLPSGQTWPYRITYNANGNQSVVAGVYNRGLYNTGTSGIRIKGLSGDITVADTLLINGFAAVAINANTLTLNGILAQTGFITGGTTSNMIIGSNTEDAGTLLMNQTSTATRSLNNFTLSRATGADAVVLGNQLRVIGTVKITDGILASNGNLVFVSSAPAVSAQLDAVTGTGNVSGKVQVQRYIVGRVATANTKWRFLASSVTTDDEIDNNWQQQIHITGAGSGGTYCPSLTSNSNGFDATSTGNASFYTWDMASQAWVSIANTNATELQSGKGYRVFVRGDRVAQGCNIMATTPVTPSDVTLSANGTLAIGTQNYTCAAAALGYALVGNPFQATIDWESAGVTKTNLSGTIFGFRPDGLASGAYGSLNGGIGTNGMTQYIAPGTSFWVQTNGTGSGLLSIAESAKSVTQGGFGYFKTSTIPNVFRIKLSMDTLAAIDEVVLAQKDGTSWSYDMSEDAEKFSFGSNQLALFTPSAGTRYAICRIPSFDSLNNRINIDAKTVVGNNYSFNFDGLSTFTSVTGAILTDTYTGVTQDLSVNTTYSFTTPDAAATASGRFYITFSQGSSSLPVKLVSFNGTANERSQTELTWKTAGEINSDKFEVERSNTAGVFETIGTVKASRFSSNTVTYHFTDAAPVKSAANYYRLKQLDRDGSFTYSKTIVVEFAGYAQSAITASDITMYPVPVKDQLMLQVSSSKVLVNPAIRMYDMFGKQLSLPMEMQDAKWTIHTEALKDGVYIIQLENNGITTQLKVMKN